MESKRLVITFSVMMLITSQAHASFTNWIQNLFGIKPVDQTRYEPTKEGYRIKKSYPNTAKIKKNDGNHFAKNRPPFKAEVGTVWVRKADRWKLVTNEEFVQEKQAKVRDSYANILGAKIPLKKSIYVYNVNNGRETMLRSNKNYSIQVAGYGPRHSIRVNVFNSAGEQLPGDFITLSRNVTAGTDSALATKALEAIKEIQTAGDVTPFCRVDNNYGVIVDGEEDNGDTAVPAIRRNAHPTDHYKKGCEALADGVTPSDRESLKMCKNSLLAWVNGSGGNMCNKLERIFSLNEQEQNFIGMLFTTRAEAPGGLPGGAPDHLMIMKTLENRRSAARRLGWHEPIAMTDIAFQFNQYSAFNDYDGNGQFDHPGFLKNRGYDKLVDSFITYQTAKWKPPGIIDNITHYYSPLAMRPRNSTPRWVRSGIRRNGAKEVTKDIRVNGRPVEDASNTKYGYHKFYTGIDGRNNYSASRDSRRKITHQCNR